MMRFMMRFGLRAQRPRRAFGFDSLGPNSVVTLEPRALLSGTPAYELEPTAQYTGTTLALISSPQPTPTGYPAGTIALAAGQTFIGQYSMITHQYDSASGTSTGVFEGASTPSYVLVDDPPVATSLNDIIINDLQLNTFQMNQNLSGLAPQFGTNSTGALAYNLCYTSTGQPVTSPVSWSGEFSLSYALPSVAVVNMSHLALSSYGISVTWFGDYFTATYATPTGQETYTTYSFSPGSTISIQYDLVNAGAYQPISWGEESAAQWFLPSYSGPYQQTAFWSLTDNYSLYGVTTGVTNVPTGVDAHLASSVVAHPAPIGSTDADVILGSLNGLFTTPDPTSTKKP
jgi:hypothetical protein